jgi:hypothetical protein
MSSYNYIQYPIETNPQDLLDEAVSYIKNLAPAWVDNDANLDVWIMQVLTSQNADLRSVASDVPDTIFRYFGASLLNIVPIDDTPARCNSTWTMKDTAGYTIPDGTFVSIRDSAGNDVPFQTDGDVLVPPGQTVTLTAQVHLVAVNPGADTSGLGSVGGTISLLDTLDFVISIRQETVTSGGVDAETSSQYNDRLARHLRRLSTRPILPDDFAALAADTDPSVYRVIAIDGYLPSNNSYNNARTIAISGIDVNGNNLDGTVKANITAAIQANREVNFVVNLMDPKRTTVAVTFTALAVVGYDPVQAQSDAIAAVQNYLSPAAWGRDPRYQDNQQTWIQVNYVYFYEIAQVIGNVQGIDRLQTLTIGLQGGSMGTSDVALATPATLTVAGTITGTVTGQ